MTLKAWPYFLHEGEWSVPDDVMAGLWKTIHESGRGELTFYDGSVKDTTDFINLMRDQFCPVLIIDDEKIKFHSIGWLNSKSDGKAFAHFCYVGRYSREPALMTIDFWKQFPELHVLIGVTPETYTGVIKIIQDWGFEVIGKIPSLCNMVYKGEREAGIISYYLMEE